MIVGSSPIYPVMKKILVCGSRDWHLAEPIRAALQELLEHTAAQNIMIIHGGARGADTIAGDIGKQLGMAVARVDANWDHYHKAAGAFRNKWMHLLEPDYVLAFTEDYHKSRGTKNMVKLAQSGRAVVRIYTMSTSKIDFDHESRQFCWFAYMRSQDNFVEVESPWTKILDPESAQR